MLTDTTFPTLDDVLQPAPRLTGLGLDVLDLEAVILAVVDRDDFTADTEMRARLARARAALERELARMLAE